MNAGVFGDVKPKDWYRFPDAIETDVAAAKLVADRGKISTAMIERVNPRFGLRECSDAVGARPRWRKSINSIDERGLAGLPSLRPS